MTIDIERLKVDREYWDSVAPEGANRYYNNSHYQCFLKHSSLDYLYHLSSGEWWPIPLHAIQSHLDCSFPRPEPRQVEWDGEGLPPVGCKCEYTGNGDEDKGVIVAHVTACPGGWGAIIQCEGDWHVGEKGDFRPIRTKDQREAGELYSDAQKAGLVNFTESMADAIIAAGWRKAK